MILSEGAYKISNKFTFGGYSYGTNPMNLPPPMPGMNDFSHYGYTMFMQYKVGKNFKIETRFNISKGGRLPWFLIWNMDTGCWILDTGCWMLMIDTG